VHFSCSPLLTVEKNLTVLSILLTRSHKHTTRAQNNHQKEFVKVRKEEQETHFCGIFLYSLFPLFPFIPYMFGIHNKKAVLETK